MGLATVASISLTSCNKIPEELPNILWIVSEDNSAYFTGCYGNDFATTPNIDKLAGEGFLYTHAYCTNAVCSPSRNTIITGVYSASNGNEQMRSNYPISDEVHTYAEYLRQAGYYCTNNSKTDYNTPSIDPNEIWDESSNKAHYKNRPEGKPFFAVFNSMTSHESSIFRQIPTAELRHNPEDVPLPPYHPETPEMRHDWAQYYDMIEDMDTWVGDLLQELDSLGFADNTIVFYYGDNGGVLARSKRFIYETGTQIPLVIRIPEKYKYLYPAKKPGDKVDRIVNFVDLAPTLLSIAGVPIPDYMQGKAFLGKEKTADPEYTFMSRQRMDERYDHVRAVRDKQYRYIRNNMPFRITMQHVAFLFNAPSAQSWEDAFKAGKNNEVQSRFFLTKPVEELYDTENDYWEINNLADDPAYADVLERMRNALDQWEKDYFDAGLVPETDYENFMGNASMYDYMRSPACPFNKLLEASRLATLGSAQDISQYIEYLKDENSAIRYWGVTGLLIHNDNAQDAIPALMESANDQSAAVATLSAETLYNLGEKEAAIKTYIRLLQDTVNYSMTDRNYALNSIDAINDASPEIISVVQKMYNEKSASVRGFARYSVYDISMSDYLLRKWGILE
ncbi:MAG: sulfatase [Bacteroides sp. SM23_62_1]|nr:MAG: sulfatase [Bacteroides sp. SM23_62_1]